MSINLKPRTTMKRENLKRANEINRELNDLANAIEQIRNAQWVSFTTTSGYPMQSYLISESELAGSFTLKCIYEKELQIEKLLIELETL